MPLSGQLAHAVVLADVNDANAERWCAEGVAILDDLAAHGPTDDELETERGRSGRQASYVTLQSGLLEWNASQHLLGEPFESRSEARRLREEVTPDAVAAAFAAARSTLFVLGPESVDALDGFTAYPLTSLETIEGRRHRPRSFRDRLRRSLRRAELTASPEGVTLTSPAGTAITARFDSTVLCVREPGTRTLLTDDGFFVPVTGSDWQDGEAVLASIDAAIPAELVVSESPGADDVERLTAATFKRTWHVSDELAVLPGLLADGEKLLALGAASRGWRWGLIAVTDARFCFVYGDGSSRSLFVDREDVSGVRVDGSTLHLTADGEDVELTSVEPRGKAEELARLLGTVSPGLDPRSAT
jgi:hypothetical protein